jgi:hypothetical protein
MTDNVSEIKRLLESCSTEEREEIFQQLRQELSRHPLEVQLNTQAETILEAISLAGPLAVRMIRGVIAQATFATEIVENLQGWQDVTPPRDLAYDFELTDGYVNIRVQVKLQRSVLGQPLRSDRIARKYAFSPSMYVVETQRTRGGNRQGKKTRPYTFGEFDILAVSMYPSTNNWKSFMYTVASWLLPDQNNPDLILVYQPVALKPNADWTDDFLTCVSWFRSGQIKRIHR